MWGAGAADGKVKILTPYGFLSLPRSYGARLSVGGALQSGIISEAFFHCAWRASNSIGSWGTATQGPEGEALIMGTAEAAVLASERGPPESWARGNVEAP